MDCWNCEKNIDRKVSFEVITKEGITRICKECFESGEFPLVNKNTEKTIPQGIYSQKRYEERKKENPVLKKQEQELKEIVSQNYSKHISKFKPENLIDNFHWIIMRARRMKKLTQEQFAREIKEPEIAIKKIEQGELPEKYNELIKKIENTLSISLFKNKKNSFEQEVKETKEKLIENVDSGEINFDNITTRTLTIDDLKKMKEKNEEEILKPNKRIIPEKSPSENKPEFVEENKKRELTQEEIDKIVFGK